MIIAPGRQFLVDYKINNPSDTATHYVRAVIKNAVSGVTLTTLNLTDNGSNYFSYLWLTPVDTSGTGLQITIFTTVYDDSGYTQESLVYGTTATTYIVRDLAGVRNIFGGGSTTKVDYEKIQGMIEQAVQSIPQPVVGVAEDNSDEIKDEIIAKISQIIDEQITDLRGSVEAAQKESEKRLLKEILSSAEFKFLKQLPKKFAQAETSDEQLHSLVEKRTSEIQEKTDSVLGTIIEKVKSMITGIKPKPVLPSGPTEQQVLRTKAVERLLGLNHITSDRQRIISKLV